MYTAALFHSTYLSMPQTPAGPSYDFAFEQDLDPSSFLECLLEDVDVLDSGVPDNHVADPAAADVSASNASKTAKTRARSGAMSAEVKMTRVREQNRIAQAKYRQKLKDQVNGIQSKVNSAALHLRTAKEARDSRRELNTQLNTRLGEATATLLQLEQQATTGGLHWSSDRLASRSGSHSYTGTGGSEHSRTPSTSHHSNSNAAAVSSQSHPSCSSERPQSNQALPGQTVVSTRIESYPPGGQDALLNLHPIQMRPLDTFSQKCALFPDEAVTDMVNVDSPADDCSASTAYISKQLRERDIEAVQQYVSDFGSSVEAYLTDTCAPAASDQVCWYMQTPWRVSKGARLSFTTSMSTISCCMSMFACILGTMLESTFIVKIIEQRCGTTEDKGRVVNALFENMARNSVVDVPSDTLSIMQMLDKIVSFPSAFPPGVKGCCGVGDDFFMESGIAYMFSNICKRYRKLLPPALWMDAVTDVIKFAYHKRMGQDCRARCMMTSMFKFSENSGVNDDIACPKCTVLPCFAATLRSDVRACQEEMAAPPVPPNMSPPGAPVPSARDVASEELPICRPDADIDVPVEVVESSRRKQTHTAFGVSDLVSRAQAMPEQDVFGISNLLAHAHRIQMLNAMMLRQGLKHAPQFFRRLKLYSAQPGQQFTTIETAKISLFQTLQMTPSQMRLTAAMWWLWQRQRKNLDHKFNRALVNLIRVTSPSTFPPLDVVGLLNRVNGSVSETASHSDAAGVTTSEDAAAGDACAQAHSTRSYDSPCNSDDAPRAFDVMGQSGPNAGQAHSSGRLHSDNMSIAPDPASCSHGEVPEITALLSLMPSGMAEADEFDDGDLDDEEHACGASHKGSHQGDAASCPKCVYRIAPMGASASGRLHARAQQSLKVLLQAQDDVGTVMADTLAALAAPGRIFSSRQLLSVSPHNLQFGEAMADLLKICEISAAELRGQEILGPFMRPGEVAPHERLIFSAKS